MATRIDDDVIKSPAREATASDSRAARRGRTRARRLPARPFGLLHRLALLAEIDGGEQEARLWYQRDLEVAENLRLASCADYQIDLVTS